MSNAVNAPDSGRSNNVDDRPVTPTDQVAADGTTTLDRREVVGREKDAFGGMKFGSCFFGWLTASGAVVLLVALVTGVGGRSGSLNPGVIIGLLFSAIAAATWIAAAFGDAERWYRAMTGESD